MLDRRKRILCLICASALFCIGFIYFCTLNYDFEFKISPRYTTRWPKQQFADDDEQRDKFDDQQLASLNERIWNEIVQKEQHMEFPHLECRKIIDGDQNYINVQSLKRITYKEDPKHLAMDCAAIRARNHFIERPMSAEEAQFPIAYARIVYEDYRFLEAELATNYHPQNWYCFAVDKKADSLFRYRMHALADCFDNVVIPPGEEVVVDSAGHNMAVAFMSCLKDLAKRKREWKYVITLQNHDVQVKTNQELVQIFKWLGGANDIQFEFEHGGPQEMIRLLHEKFKWKFSALKLFKNDSLNHRLDTSGKPLALRLAKGQVQASLARHFVDFLVQKLDLSKMIAQLDSWNYGADELFFQALGSADHLNAPGGFTHKCYDQKVNVPHMTRYTVWDYGPGRWENVGTCYSKINRHSICMLGIEDLLFNLRDSTHLFVNKMMPWADLGAILCWHEEMRRRTLVDRGLHRLDAKFYQQWPQTRFYKEWLNNSGNVDLEHFDCGAGGKINF